VIPLLRDEIEVFPDSVDRLGIELEVALATLPGTVDDPRTLKNTQMLGDGLASEP